MLPKVGIFGTGAIVQSIIPILREKGFHVEGNCVNLWKKIYL